MNVITNAITDAITQFFVNIFGGLAQQISALFTVIVPLLGNTPLNLTTANNVVDSTWVVMTGVADAFLGIIILGAAIQMLYGQATGTVYLPLSQFVPKLILTAILIHMSRIIGQDLILLDNALCGLVHANILAFIQQMQGGPLNTTQILKTSFIFTIIGTFSLVRVLFQVFKRIVLFDILFILSGPAFLMAFHPLTVPWFSYWARLFVVTAFTHFFQFLGLGLGIQLILTSNQTGIIGIFLATAMFTLVAEIPQLLSRFSGAQMAPAGGIGTLVRAAMTVALVFR
jgi:hypothetical protein